MRKIVLGFFIIPTFLFSQDCKKYILTSNIYDDSSDITTINKSLYGSAKDKFNSFIKRKYGDDHVFIFWIKGNSVKFQKGGEHTVYSYKLLSNTSKEIYLTPDSNYHNLTGSYLCINKKDNLAFWYPELNVFHVQVSQCEF